MFLKNDVVELSHTGKEISNNATELINKRLKNLPVNKDLTRDAFTAINLIIKETTNYTANRVMDIRAIELSYSSHEDRRKQLAEHNLMPVNIKQLKA